MKLTLARCVYSATLAALACSCTGAEEVFFYGSDVRHDAGSHNRSPEITLVFVAPLQTNVGYPVTLSGAADDPDGDSLKLRWTALTGFIADPKAADTTYTCKIKGPDTVTFLVSDGQRLRSQSVQVTCK